MGDDAHPHDLIEFASYPDATVRETYPPLPRTGGNPNAALSQGAEAGILSSLTAYQQRRGKAPMDLTAPPVASPPAPELPDDPDVQAMHAAGWL